MAQKQPFERIMSLVERKKILLQLINTDGEIYLKHADGNVSLLKGIHLTPDGGLIGQWQTDNMNLPLDKVVAFFYADKHRYFIKTSLEAKGTSWELVNCSTFYRLNRRKHYRVEVPPMVLLTFYVQLVNNKEIAQSVRIIDFSAGGLRVDWPFKQAFERGSIIKGVIQWDTSEEKSMPVDAQLMHISDQNECGIKFIKLSPIAQTGLKAWAIELQQIALFK